MAGESDVVAGPKSQCEGHFKGELGESYDNLRCINQSYRHQRTIYGLVCSEAPHDYSCRYASKFLPDSLSEIFLVYVFMSKETLCCLNYFVHQSFY
jgi:hypothetical protein